MKWNIQITKEVAKRIFTLMHHIEDLNNGDEIGGWLSGVWSYEKETAKLILDNFFLPEQDVSSVEVDLTPDSMIHFINEIGIEEGNRIQAHWHIHPFGKGDTDWSKVDEEKISTFMDQDYDVFVFLLSSEDQLKARVELRSKNKIDTLDQEIVFRQTYDDLPVSISNDESDKKVYEELKKEIKEKVKRQKTTTITFPTKKGKNSEIVYCNSGNLYDLQIIGDDIVLTMEASFVSYLQSHAQCSERLLKPTKQRFGDEEEIWIYCFNSDDHKDKFYNKLDEELLNLESEYFDLMNNYTWKDYR